MALSFIDERASLGSSTLDKPPDEETEKYDPDGDAHGFSVLQERLPVLPEEEAGPGEREGPGKAAEERVHGELDEGHLGHARRKADERPNDRKQAGDEDRRLSVFLEPHFGSVELVRPKKDVSAPPLDERPSSHQADPVGEPGTQNVRERPEHPDPEEIESASGHEEASEDHRDFGGDGDAGRFQDHQDDHGVVAVVADDFGHEVFEGFKHGWPAYHPPGCIPRRRWKRRP